MFDVLGMVVLLKRKSIEAPIQAAFGVRKKESDYQLTAADTFHIGSTTKAFTSTLLALLVSVGSPYAKRYEHLLILFCLICTGRSCEI